MKKFVFFFLTLLLVSCVHGDGGGYYYTYGRDTLYPLSESSQTALINYEDGVEDLLISIRTNPEGDGLFWIFPVPSNPEDSEIELVEEFPQISGYEPKSKLGLEIKNTRDLMYLSQIYPSSFLMNPLFIVGRGGGTYQESRKDNGISIHQSVEKSGVVSQLISCRDEGGLSNYLSGKGFSVPEDLKSVVEEYIGENYSFVVSWITNKEEYREGLEEGDIALRVKFSTEKIFYPLKMTSIYGEERIPIHVYVLGRVTPELYEDIEYGSVNYFISNEYEIPSELSSFFNADGTIKGLKYSRVRIYTESINLGEDLWFSEGVSNRILLADYLAPLTPIINILFFALFSCLASLVAGLVVYRGKVSLKELIFLGLSNFLTLIGFSIIASRVLSKKPELAGREEKKNRRIWYIPFLLPFAIMIILLIIVGYPIYYDLIQFALYYLFLFIIFGVPVLFLLLISLNLANISGFRTYVIFFSILFLVLSYAGTSFLLEVYPPQEVGFGGYSGFGQIKPTSFGATEMELYITLTNGVGVRVEDVEVFVEGDTEYIDSIPAGGKGEVAFLFLPDFCTPDDLSYDVKVNVSYTNSVTGLNHGGSGRLWGPC